MRIVFFGHSCVGVDLGCVIHLSLGLRAIALGIGYALGLGIGYGIGYSTAVGLCAIALAGSSALRSCAIALGTCAIDMCLCSIALGIGCA